MDFVVLVRWCIIKKSVLLFVYLNYRVFLLVYDVIVGIGFNDVVKSVSGR